MTRLWRTYIALWAGSFGEMPSVATFRARLLLLLWHTAALIALIGLLSLFGCDDSTTLYVVRHNLCNRRGRGWSFLTSEWHGVQHLDSFRCVHVDSIAPVDSVIVP